MQAGLCPATDQESAAQHGLHPLYGPWRARLRADSRAGPGPFDTANHPSYLSYKEYLQSKVAWKLGSWIKCPCPYVFLVYPLSLKEYGSNRCSSVTSWDSLETNANGTFCGFSTPNWVDFCFSPFFPVLFSVLPIDLLHVCSLGISCTGRQGEGEVLPIRARRNQQHL